MKKIPITLHGGAIKTEKPTFIVNDDTVDSICKHNGVNTIHELRDRLNKLKSYPLQRGTPIQTLINAIDEYTKA
jgi:hypothetical protein